MSKSYCLSIYTLLNRAVKLFSIVLVVAVLPIQAQNINPRIINGSDIVSDAPWVASLSEKSSSIHFCGGTLISSDTIVTAAHCVIDFQQNPANLRITLGRKTLSDKSQGKDVDAAHIVIHPLYDLNSLDHDIALVKLSEKTDLSIAHITSSSSYIYEHDVVMNILGWGYTDTQFTIQPNTLQQASIPVIDQESCSRILGTEFNPSTMFCAGVLSSNVGIQNGIDTCNGDSGGPIGFFDNDTFILTGITSWGYECASAKYPGVYVKISEFYDWINTNPQDEPYALSRPKVKGLPVVGSTLTCFPGNWSDGITNNISFQWIDAKTGLIRGAKRSKYKLRKRDIGRRLSCEVTKTRSLVSSSSRSKTTGYVFPVLSSVNFNKRTNHSIKNVFKGCVNKECYVMLNMNETPKSLNAIATNLNRCNNTTQCNKNTRWHNASAKIIGDELWGFIIPTGFEDMLMYVRLVLKNDATSVIEVNIH